jgi:glycosyltransferase involved in cell wall biosynthesis
MQVSVVIISKDEPELDETLSEIESQCAPHGWEILVVDASAGRLDWIKEKHPEVRWMAYQPPVGRGSSIPQQRNVGVRAALGRVIAFCDSGGIPQAGWLEALVNPILEGTYRYTCGPVTSRRAGVYRTINDVAEGSLVEGPPTANVALSRELFEAVGGFDERYAYGSDVDIAWRCIRLGAGPRNVRAAVMTMDWGPWELQKKRSWRYGRARARLGRYHGAHTKILRGQPEIPTYPLLSLATVVAVVGTGFSRRFGAVVGGGASLLGGLLWWRNRNQTKPKAVMLGHLIYGWGYATELLIGPRGETGPAAVLHSPEDDGPYVGNLTRAIAAEGTGVSVLNGPTGSRTVNLLLEPFMLAWGRVRGVRIWHLHWSWGHDLHWVRWRGGKRVLRWWFGFNLRVAKRLGIKIIWTAHNLYPHEPVFDDDRAARRMLVAAADLIIAHTPEAKAAVEREFGVERVLVVDQGYIEHGGVGREVAREDLGIGEDQHVVLGFGKILRYKGFTTMLEAGLHLDPELAKRTQFRLIGACADRALRTELEDLASRLNRAGVETVLEFTHVPDERLAAELAGADVCVYMFHQSLNSSSIRAAQRAGRIAIVGRGTGLAAGHGCIEGGGTAEECARAIESVITLEGSEREALEAEARGAATRSWRECAVETIAAYRRVLDGGRR